MRLNDNTMSSNYRAMTLDACGRILSVERLSAPGDREAMDLARAMVDGHAVDLWDGLRFIECFEPVDRSIPGSLGRIAGPAAPRI